MPTEERTMPSSRSVLTCKPALPGGRFLPAFWSFWRLTSDSNGSRREPLSPPSPVLGAAEADASVEPAAAALAPAGAAVLALADLDFEALGLGATCGGGSVCTPLARLVCAINPGAAASKIPTIILFTERMFLLIPFTASLPSRAWQLPCQRAW